MSEQAVQIDSSKTTVERGNEAVVLKPEKNKVAKVKRQQAANKRQSTGNGARARIATQSKKLPSKNGAERYSKIAMKLNVCSFNLGRLIDADLNDITVAAANVIPLIQIISREDGYQTFFNDFVNESTGNVKALCKTTEEMLELIKSNDERLLSRLEFIEMSTAVQFEINFFHPFFWSYIEMLGDADKQLAEIERLTLTGLVGNDLEQHKKDLINAVKSTFKALVFISKVKPRRDANSTFKLDTLKLVQTNYRNRIAALIGEEEEVKA